MTFYPWRDELLRQFRLFGLPQCLSEAGQRELHAKGFTPDSAYGVACDLYAGWDWRTAVAANAESAQ